MDYKYPNLVMGHVMHAKGQTAVDVVMALIVVLVILSIFTNIHSQFQLTQKEISLRQQLRENAFGTAQFITQAGWYIHSNPSLPLVPLQANIVSINNFTSFSGQSNLYPIRALEKAQGFDCLASKLSSSVGTSTATEWTLQLKLISSDTKLSQDVNEISPFIVPLNFPVQIPTSNPALSRVIFSSCYEPVVIP